MLRTVLRFTGLVLPAICTLTAFVVLLSFMPITGSSSSARSLTNQTTLEQSPSDPPTPGEQLVASRIFLPQVYKVNPRGEHPPADAQLTIADSYTNRVSPPIANFYTSISGMGGELDQYLDRTGTIDGRLTFTIALSAPVLEPETVNPDNGLLNAVYLPRLVRDHKLPTQAMLVLRIYDVDDDEGLICPEIDYVLINGNRIKTWEMPDGVFLRGGNEKWKNWSVSFSPSMLRFPTASSAENSQPTSAPAINEIAIDVDAICQITWAVEVDWGAIVLGPNIRYPIVLVHGWTGDKDTFKFSQFDENNIYNMYPAKNLEAGVRPWDRAAELLATEVISVTQLYHTTKVNIFAHSRGGLFTR